MKKENFEVVAYDLGFAFNGCGGYQIELCGNVSTFKVEVSLNYNFIEGNEILLDDCSTKNLYNIDRYDYLLQQDILLFREKFNQLKAIIEKGEK